MRLLLDTNLLLRLCHPSRHPDVRAWFQDWIAFAQSQSDVEIAISAAADYELRRGYLYGLDRHEDEKKALSRLDKLCTYLGVQPISEWVLHQAAQMWAEARHGGYSTAPDRDIDWDVIIAAQAKEIPAVVVTNNERHLSRYDVDARDWEKIPVPGRTGSGEDER